MLSIQHGFAHFCPGLPCQNGILVDGKWRQSVDAVTHVGSHHARL